MPLQMLLCDYAIDVIEPYAIWVSVAIFAALLIASAIIYFVKRNSGLVVVKKLAFAAVIYALVLGIVMLVLEIMKKYNVAYLEENWVSLEVVNFVFIPIVVTLSVMLVGLLVSYLIPSKKVIKVVFTALSAALLVATLVLIAIYYANNISNDGYYSEFINPTVLWIMAALVIIVAVAVALIVDKSKKGFDTKCITFAGITIALSFALSYVKLFELPNGGAVTLVSMFPIMLFAYMYGMKKGLIVGLIYGLLQAIQDPYIIHPAQFLLDYPIAFMMLGFAGVLSGTKFLSKVPAVKFIISAIIAGSFRYIAHVLSGVFAFGAYADIENLWLYSLGYNVFVFVDVALVLVIGAALLSQSLLNTEMKKYLGAD